MSIDNITHVDIQCMFRSIFLELLFCSSQYISICKDICINICIINSRGTCVSRLVSFLSVLNWKKHVHVFTIGSYVKLSPLPSAILHNGSVIMQQHLYGTSLLTFMPCLYHYIQWFYGKYFHVFPILSYV